MKCKICIIGSGFAALSAACYLAKAGNEVHVYEKNKEIGGRARRYIQDGFTFDMGPTWYWMPDVFERFFQYFGKKVDAYYSLEKLDPAYTVYFNSDEKITIAADIKLIYDQFEEIEKGSANKLKEFLHDAETNYKIAVKDMVYRPGVSMLELLSTKTITRFHHLFVSIRKKIRQKFRNQKLIKILEFPVLFLGAKPSNTPSMYNFMNWADFGLGTWHPIGGMYEVVLGIKKLADSLGVQFYTNATVEKILTSNNIANGVVVDGKEYNADIVVSGADYHFTETLLESKQRQYSESYWNKKTFAPSSLLFYVGFSKKLHNVTHHTLFFDTDFELHAEEIYDNPQWPSKPLFYASFPSITDTSFAPVNYEAATFLIPIAPDLEDNELMRQKYFDIIIDRLEKITKQELKKYILFSKSYCVADFKKDYNSYKGNAYGLANILTQTAFLRPKLKSKKVKNLYFTGQLTVPGPGVPPALISGKVVSELIIKNNKK